MIGLVKDDWLINNHNVFELQQDIELSISVIQYEMLNQIGLKDINSIEKYLRFKVDISQEIWGTENLTIEKVFADFLGLESINPLEQITIKISQVLNYLQLSLLKEYYENKHKNILTFSQYKTQYNLLLQSFLNSNIDTDEQDFIKAELSFCNKLINELDKPVYSLISPLNKIVEKPCDFKKNLTNSIDKRKKFLEQKGKEKLQPVKENETEKKIEIWYSEYELRRFIDMALRWGIDAVYNSRTEKKPYSVYDNFVKNARINFDLFAQQLNTKLTENENWKAIEIDLNNRFLKGLKKYIIWYNENREELKKFQPYCPYSLMLNVIESTKAEIIKYFPDLETEAIPPLQTEMPKPEINETDLSKKIEKHFGFLLGNCPRKGVPILNNEQDFENLVKWTTSFYENNFEVPEISQPIKAVNTNDYYTQLAFLYLFDELRKSGFHNQRTRAKTLFNLWECCFSDYKGYSEKNFWKVKHENGKDVKERMKINY
ncbi:hypothetical protein [Croceibacter atlanticus]|uniref:hypothetical protein n=1 Tax=Croceibacter atlanticus TaxID=313588 RepID=UPI0030DAC1EB|tara:strand:- start:23545 stop:25008 length:1464 start_codon:yes stop_codon:yes gene_type:complete